MQEVLVDGRELVLEDFVQVLDDSGITLSLKNSIRRLCRKEVVTMIAGLQQQTTKSSRAKVSELLTKAMAA